MADRRKRSNVWLHYSVVNSDKARCDICKTEISIRCGSTSNLGKHLRLKHVSVTEGLPKKAARTTPSATAETSSNQSASAPSESNIPPSGSSSSTSILPDSEAVTTPATLESAATQSHPRKRKLNTLSDYVVPVRPTSIARQKRLNRILLRMIVKDMQPFSVVTDDGFREFIAALDPSYSLPDRKTLTQELLPSMYRDAVDNMKTALEKADAVTLTTDGWTSLTTEGYLAVTAHCIDSEFSMHSYLLECVKYSERHTADNLAEELQRCIREWGLEGKVIYAYCSVM